MNFYAKAGGTAAKPITFIADPGVVIHSKTTSGANADYAGINIESTGGWYVIDGFTVDGTGVDFRKAGIRVALSDNVILRNTTVHNAFTGIFVSYSSGVVAENNLCYNATDQHGAYFSEDTNFTIRNNIFHNNQWDGLHLNAVTQNISGGIIEGNVIYANG